MSIALWCVLIAALLPLVAAALAKAGNARAFDNHNPREWLARQTGAAARANAAQANSFEAFPFFAAAVIVAAMLHAPQERVDLLAMIFIAARAAYIWCYVTDRATLRSFVWLVGMGCTVTIFVAGA